MLVRFKRLHPDAVVPFKKYPEDFCYDVVATSEEQIAPNVWKYGIGLAFEIEGKPDDLVVENEFGKELLQIPQGRDWNVSLDLRPRSSIYKTGMVLSNAVGTVDDLYRGEVSAIFYHVFPDMPRYRVGDRIGQIKLGITHMRATSFQNHFICSMPLRTKKPESL